MKKYLFLLIANLSFVSYSFAQNRKIEFTTEDFSGALAKAETEKKMVFMDCYTTWCGPCKLLSAQIFTQDAVADYFNAHFVSVKMDMEKGEGKALRDKYGIKAYPTLLFINPDSDEMHRTMGFMPAEKLIAEAKKASDPNWCSTCIAKRLKSGEKSPELLFMYFLQQRENQELRIEETESFFAAINDADFTSKPFWGLVYNFVGGASTISGKRLMTLRDDFKLTVTSDSLETKIAMMHDLYNYAPMPSNMSDEKVRTPHWETGRKLAESLYFKNKKIKEDLLDVYDIELLGTKNNWIGVCEAIERNFKSVFIPQDAERQWNMRLWRVQTSEARTEAEVLIYIEKWAQEAYATKPNDFYSNYIFGKTLKRCGKNAEAIVLLERALQFDQKEASETQEIKTILGSLKHANDQVIMGYKLEKNQVIFDFDPKLYTTASGTNGGWSTLKDLNIQTVNIAGDFNDWKPDNNQWKMKFNKHTQTYQLEVAISARKRMEKITIAPDKIHIFKFVVNGNQWVMPTEKTKNITLEAGKDFSYSNMTLELAKP